MTGPVDSERAYTLLEAVPADGLTTRESTVVLPGGPALHGLDGNGRRHLLLPVPESAELVEDSRSAGVTVSTRTWVDGDSERRFIDMRCDDNRLKDLFATVCDEVLDGCTATPDLPGTVVRTVLERWRDLLGPASRHLLGESDIKGLLAELHVLEHLARISPVAALDVWSGADAARHDFTGPHDALEVKASSLVDEVRVHINGLTQLLEPPGKALHLWVERMERVPAGGDTIPQTTDRLQILGVPLVRLLRLLGGRGVHAADMDAYARIRFVSLEERLYRVDNTFPRVVPSMLTGSAAEGRVVRVEYVLDLGTHPPDPLPPESVDTLAKRLLSSHGVKDGSS